MLIQHGQLLIDIAQLKRPEDLLHEADHISLTPLTLRANYLVMCINVVMSW